MDKICKGPCGLEKPLQEFHKDSTAPDGHVSKCKQCVKESGRIYRLNNPGKGAEAKLAYARANAVHFNAQKKEWAHNNQEKVRCANAAYIQANIAKVRAGKIRWNKNNRAKMNAIKSKRRAAELQRIPAWLTIGDWSEIRWAYAIARNRTTETGIEQHVDHIIPLQGKYMSGLHIPCNLRIIPAHDNQVRRRNILPFLGHEPIG